jgi:hypothetical protein
MGTSLWESIKQSQAARLGRGPITRPVKLTIDEADLLRLIAFYMLEMRGLTPDAATLMSEGLRSVSEMVTINRGRAYSISFPWRRSISREDLEVLAPYIDEWIDRPPPQDLPSEYYDWRPDVLTPFKARMLKEGLWPASEMSKRRGQPLINGS